jgi:hypothetical protein
VKYDELKLTRLILGEGAHVMARVRSILTVAILLIVFVSVGNAQQGPATDSVADAAREQKALNPKQKKSAQKKVYTNSDVGPSGATPSKNDTQANRAGPAMVKNSENPDSGAERSPIFDRSKQEPPETIVVAAGTKITVDVFEENPPRNLPLRVHSAKVINIVQVGSTVVIPALSKVTIQESTGVMELTDVTIDGVRYDLETDRVPLFAESMSEATFTLTNPFTIKR